MCYSIKFHTLYIERFSHYILYCPRQQGSLLLFLIFCNDIYLNITYSKLILFADNTTIYCSHENDNYLCQVIEQDIISLMDKFNANKLSLNLLKTVSISFHNNKKIKLNIKTDGKSIAQVEHFND